MLSQIVKTVNGEKVPRSTCRKIKGEFHIMNKDCFQLTNIDGIQQWYRKDNEDVYYDCELERYELLSVVSPIHGIIDIKDGELIYGHFSPNQLKNSRIITEGGNTPNIFNVDIAKQAGLGYSVHHGMFSTVPKYIDNSITPGQGHYSYRGAYSSNNMMDVKIDRFNKWNHVDNSSSEISKIVGNHSFGVEFELEGGVVCEPYLWRNGLICLRDGSIRGDEFATIPLRGNLGVNKLRDGADLLQKTCMVSKFNSLHIHIGGVPQTKENTWAIYMVNIALQEEIYSLFPAVFQHTGEFKRQDYCSPLNRFNVRKDSSVDEKFESLFDYYSAGHSFKGFGKDHPVASLNNAKWHLPMR